ncbi:MAG: beta strand repeat-containing protein, partial [Acidimicrobiales bacterium]
DILGVSNVGTATNTSDGSATTPTGDAVATGNPSLTNVGQLADTDGDGSGFAIVDQSADVDNSGSATAETGGNVAIGNASTNAAANFQAAAAGSVRRDVTADKVVASNVGAATNDSDGSADITTGDACAIGNTSITNVGQLADVGIDGSGFVIVDQSATVDNFGEATADTGDNAAFGNLSANAAVSLQLAAAGSRRGDVTADDIVASNVGAATNTSDGSATISTGDAFAAGNASVTNVGQLADADIDGSGFVIVDQEADVTNAGFADADTGDNLAIGNLSGNFAVNLQLAAAGSRRGDVETDILVASNIGTADNTSDGTATINTGDADAIGNTSITNVGQLADVGIDGSGFVIVDQSTTVDNFGEATADTGDNAAFGNLSANAAVNLQLAVAGSRRGDVDADTVVASNVGAATNTSDGSATISTGDALAAGNTSATDVVQVADFAVDGFGGFTLVNQSAGVVNFGSATASTGDNAAFGNLSANFAANDQLAAAGSLFGDVMGTVVANNTGDAANDSDGFGGITTGDAGAFGNLSGGAELPDFPTCKCGEEETPPEVLPPGETPPGETPPEVTPPEVTPPEEVTPETPPTTPVVEVVEVFNKVTAPAQAGLAVTGVSVAVQILFGLLLLAIGALLRRKSATA